MAKTTLITTPNVLSPINDLYGNYFQIDAGTYSDFASASVLLSSHPNFNYNIQLYANNNVVNSNTFSFLTQDNIPPRPITGYGLYSGYKSLVSNISYDLNGNISSPTFSNNSLISYYIRYGVQYNPARFFPSGSTTVLPLQFSGNFNVGGFFGFSLGAGHTLLSGDVITIVSANPFYNGTSSVTTSSSTSIVISVPFTASIAPLSTITNTQRWTATSSTFYGFNGTRRYGSQNIDYSDYINIKLGQQNGNYLTDYIYNPGPQNYLNIITGSVSSSPISFGGVTVSFGSTVSTSINKLILASQSETLSCFIYPVLAKVFGSPGTPGASISSGVMYKFYDNSNNFLNYTYSIISNIITSTFSNSIVTTPPDYVYKMDIPVGTNSPNIKPFLLSNPLIAKYDVQVGSIVQSFPVGSPTLFFPTLSIAPIANYQIDTSCSIYTNVRVMWMNSWGAFDFFNFRLDDHKTYNINRNEYKQILPVNYSIGDRQRTILSQTVVEQHVINTDWVSESIYAFLGQLLISPEVYIINESTGDAYPIILIDQTFDYKTALRDKIFQLTLTYQTSYDINTQNM